MTTSFLLQKLISEVVAIAEEAGKAVMGIYSQDDFATTYKGDDSPITRADTTSHAIIACQLRALTPDLPVLSEESGIKPYSERRLWSALWLIDPLDGTKEFIKRNGEFTINIALIEDSHPVLGVVHVPALAVSYFAACGVGAFKKDSDNRVKRIIVAHNCHVPLKIVTSRSHGDEGLERLLDQTVLFERIRMGSSLKFCLVAEGAAHLYPRLGPTMEWDTAAGQCVVEMAGGAVTDLQGRALIYNKPDLLNPPFMVSSSPDCPCQNFKSLFPTIARLQQHKNV